MRNRVVLVFLTVFLLLIFNGCQDLGSGNTLTFTLLQTSDLHNHAGGYGPSSDYTPGNNSDNDSVLGGFTRIASLIASVRKENEEKDIPVVVVDSGDFSMGTVYDLATADPVFFKFFQMVGYDAITLGNHEFDWSYAGLSLLLSNGFTGGFNIPVIATNMFTSDASPVDDAIEAMVNSGKIVRKKILKLSNGLRIGILGIMGVNADRLAPAAAPITFNHDYSFLQGKVDDLRNNDKVNVVILLSHGGIYSDGTGDDFNLAENVTGIDIIASGHYHTATQTAFKVGPSSTRIFSPGEYGEWLSRMDITYDLDSRTVKSFDFKLLPVDDTVKNRTVFETVISGYKAAINTALSVAGLSLDMPVSRVSEVMEIHGGKESGLGNLAADALRAIASGLAPLNDGAAYDVAIIPNGVIRDGFFPGATGTVTFTDIYNTIPLGTSPDISQKMPGYPLMSLYITGQDLRNVCEAGLTVSRMLGSDFYLNFSGIRVDYNPAMAPYFQGVSAIYLTSGSDYFTTVKGDAIDITDNTTLYHVVVDYYALQMMNAVTNMGLTIIPRDSSGNPIPPQNYLAFRIDSDPSPGMQELKEWGALLSFLKNFFPYTGNGIPQAIYGTGGAGMGRINFVQ